MQFTNKQSTFQYLNTGMTRVLNASERLLHS